MTLAAAGSRNWRACATSLAGVGVLKSASPTTQSGRAAAMDRPQGMKELRQLAGIGSRPEETWATLIGGAGRSLPGPISFSAPLFPSRRMARITALRAPHRPATERPC